ncbi:histone [archaeon SCG-AAA382B04]|nr:histone [archaeon SCG-AAA382B04]
MTELPLAPVDRIIRNGGAQRVSEEAREALAKVLEDYGEEVSEEAVKLARHANRKTVKAEDIDLAAERL